MVVKTAPVQQIKSCLGSVKGQIVFPENPNYAQDIKDENTRVMFHPTVIVFASNVKDVQAAVKCAKSLNLSITARSGGHSYEKYSTFGKIVVDVSNLNKIIINGEDKTAIIGSGNRLGPVYYNLSQAGFFIPAGSCPSVGISGHALGGGFGLYARKFGTASDNILSIDLVNADGSLITANANQNEDLFYALRGAGSNSYGIVTSFTFKIHPTPPKVTSITFVYDISKIQTLFAAFNKLGPILTDDVTLSLVLAESLQINGVYQGTKKNAQKALKNFISSSKPSSTEFIEQSLFDSVVKWGFASAKDTIHPFHSPSSFKGKSFLVNPAGLSRDGVQSIKDFILNSPKNCPTFAIFDLFGGAVNRVAEDATAFVHRNISYGIQLFRTLNGNSATNKKCLDDLKTFGIKYQKLFTSYSCYQNYIDKDLHDWQTRYYGSSFPKLVAVKRKFDPDNLFNFPQ
ncbi:28897_t:CDS:2, partial [Racocetra persica]